MNTDELIKQTERKTLDVFQRVNPTKRDFTPGDPGLLNLRKREETIFLNLGLQKEDFSGKRVLDGGCGTGDLALMLADWGAHVDAFDLNPHSVEHAKQMASKFPSGTQCTFKVGSIFEPPYEGLYDIVVCGGVMPHVGDPELAFNTLSRFVKPGGTMIVTNINRWGFLLRSAKRGIVNLLSFNKSHWKAWWAKKLWKKHIARAVKFGIRTEDQIVWDNFVAPHRVQSIGEWLRWLERNNLEYYSSYPSFYSLQLPSTSSGGIELMTTVTPPRQPVWRWALRGLVQFRWAMAYGVGGICSIAFVSKKRTGS
jgi:2-polyprenyl-3-methyl-5-hydroxy-6-metoxy-1,4-benzoquinol methylase